MIGKTDVKRVARFLGKKLTEKEIEEALELYPEEQMQDSTATWNLVMESCIEQVTEDG